MPKDAGLRNIEVLSDLDKGWDEPTGSEVRMRTIEPLREDYDDCDADGQPTTIDPLIAEFARLANPDSVPSKLPGDVASILPTKASLLWSRIDGRTPLRAILAGSGLDEAEGLRVLAALLRAQRVTFFGRR